MLFTSMFSIGSGYFLNRTLVDAGGTSESRYHFSSDHLILQTPAPDRNTLGPTGPGSRHLVTLAESVVNTNLYNNQYNEDLKELMIKTIKSFK